MDIREKKTKRSITNAFLQLRAHKQIERITIKELAELAEISKATFYLHYRDIYDLSDFLQKEVIKSILNSIPNPTDYLTNLDLFMDELIGAFHAQQHLVHILFSGSQEHILPLSIEQELKQYIFQLDPSRKNDIKFNIALSYQIQGGYYAYMKNQQQFEENKIVVTIKEIANKLKPE